MPPTDHRSELGFFKHLPPEIIIDILSRLPIRTIVICKCVCRSWRNLLCTRQFADFHLSKSVPGLVVGYGPRHMLEDLKVFEFDDELVFEYDDLHHKPLTKIESMEFMRSSVLQGSANGLLLLCKGVSVSSKNRNALYVCNPITREYIELPYDGLVYSCSAKHSYGFGVSRMSGQYKVVRVLLDCNRRGPLAMHSTMSICLVYELGTNMWRSITLPAPFIYHDRSIGVYLYGNLHWLVCSDLCISCFDLETETFSTFSLPSSVSEGFRLSMVALGDCLCVSSIAEDEVVIWLMKEYGDDKSWTKEFVIRIGPGFDLTKCNGVVHPIKVFKNGDILMALQNMYLIYYSDKTKTTKRTPVFSENLFDLVGMKAMLHTSSFFPLGSFGNGSEPILMLCISEYALCNHCSVSLVYGLHAHLM